MPHFLHLVRDASDRSALAVIRAQATDPAVRLSIVLVQGAIEPADALPGEVYRLDPPAPGARDHARPTIGHSELLDLIFAADSVVTW